MTLQETGRGSENGNERTTRGIAAKERSQIVTVREIEIVRGGVNGTGTAESDVTEATEIATETGIVTEIVSAGGEVKTMSGRKILIGSATGTEIVSVIVDEEIGIATVIVTETAAADETEIEETAGIGTGIVIVIATERGDEIATGIDLKKTGAGKRVVMKTGRVVKKVGRVSMKQREKEGRMNRVGMIADTMGTGTSTARGGIRTVITCKRGILKLKNTVPSSRRCEGWNLEATWNRKKITQMVLSNKNLMTTMLFKYTSRSHVYKDSGQFRFCFHCMLA